MTVHLVLAVTRDAEILKAISVEAFTSGFELYGRYPPGIESLAWHLTEIEKQHYYKILHDDILVGGMCIVPPNGYQVELKYFFISTALQNRGIGSKAMAQMETLYSWARAWKLYTPYKSYQNHSFYEKLGYEKVGVIQPYPHSSFKAFEYVKTARPISKKHPILHE